MYLKFESNQVLSEKHLNVTVSYLEEQIRATRSLLLGAGIVSGFEIERPTAATLKIYTGTAVTSEGYLVTLDHDNMQGTGENKFLIFDKIKNYQPQNQAFPYLGEEGEAIAQYPLFSGFSDADGDTYYDDLKLLLPNSDPIDETTTPLTSALLNNKVIVLYLECHAKDLKNCEADNCYEYGKELIFKVQPLLVSKETARMLINNEMASALNHTELQLREKLHARLKLSPLPLAKPRYSLITENYTVALWSQLFSAKLGQLVTELNAGGKATQIDTAISTILNIPSHNPITNFTSEIHKYLTQPGKLSTPQLGVWQYIYDFAQDFIDAYDELVEALLEFTSYRIKSTLSFPLHIRLGLVPALNTKTEIFSPADELYRHSLYSSHNVNEQQETYHTAVVLYNRLAKMIETFDANKIPQFSSQLKVTPGLGYTTKLSLRAIPFYYSIPAQTAAPDLKRLWNPEYNKWKREDLILNYSQNASTHTYADSGYGVNDSNEHTTLPVVYRLRDASFYRIEGVLGMTYSTAFSRVLNYRNNYGLAFEVLLLKLNKNVTLPLQNQQVYFADLESLYNVLKVEIKCLLDKSKLYFKSIKLDSGALINNSVKDFTSSKAAAKKAAPNRKITVVEEESKHVNDDIKIAGEYMMMADAQSQMFLTMPNSLGNLYANGFILDLDIVDIVFGSIKPTQSNAIAVINALEGVVGAITESFIDFDETSYRSKVDVLLNAANTFIKYAKGQTDAFFIQEKLVKKGELLDFLDRIYYECDWKKLEAVGKERKNRMDYVYKQNLLSEFVKYHPGVEHMAGVPKGGTYIIIFDNTGNVVGDLALPYIQNSAIPPIQYILGVIQNVVLTGQILDANGAPLPKAQLTIDGTVVGLDDQARYAKTVGPNQNYLMKVALESFTTVQHNVMVAENDVIKDIILISENAQPKANLQITVTNQSNQPVAVAKVTINDEQVALNEAGVVLKEVNANTTYSVTVEADGYFSQVRLVANVGTDQLNFPVVLKSKVKFGITVVDEQDKPVTSARVLLDGVVVDQIKEGVFGNDIEGTKVYALRVQATGYDTFTQQVDPKGKDVELTIKLSKAKTVSVYVGLYIAPKGFSDTSIRYATDVEVDVLFAKKQLGYNKSLQLFGTTDSLGGRVVPLSVTAIASKTEIFSQNIKLEVSDLLILITNRSGTRGEALMVKAELLSTYAISIPITDKQTKDMVLEVLQDILKIKAGMLEIQNKTLEIRIFNKEDFEFIIRMLKEKGLEAVGNEIIS